MTSKTHSSNYECCMCGDLGLSHELFRCKVCHFRSQHRYCSNLYPKAETYRVCNWCLIQKNDDHENLASPRTTSFQNSSSPENHSKTTTFAKKLIGSKSPKCLQATSPIKKAMMSGSPSGRKRTTAQAQAQAQAQQEEEKIIRRTKSEEISNRNNGNGNGNNNSSRRISPIGGSGGPGSGPAVIKHVFRNKVRRYKLLDQVSS